MDAVTLKLWYGGSFSKIDLGMVYNGKTFRTVDVDVDEFCWFTIVEEAEKCAFYKRDVDAIFFMNPEIGLQRVVDDKGAGIMCSFAVANRVVECYLISAIDVPHLMRLINNCVPDGDAQTYLKRPMKLTPKRNSFVSQTSTLVQNIAPESIPNDLVYFDFNDITLVNALSDYEENCEIACLAEPGGLESDECESEDPIYNPSSDDGLSDSDKDDSDVELIDENLFENEAVDYAYDSEDDELQEALEVSKEWNAKALKVVKQLQLEAENKLLNVQVNETVNNGKAIIVSSNGYESEYDLTDDEMDTPNEDEEDPIPGKRIKSKVPAINERTDFQKLIWCVGIRFPSRETFRDCVARYAIAQGRNCTFVVSDKVRGRKLGVKCAKGCPFKLYGSWDNKQACILVKSVNNKHTCQRNMNRNRQLKSTWLAKQFLEVFKAKPHWPASEIIESVRRAYHIIVLPNFAYKVKYYAHKLLHGSMKDHYSKLGSYIAILKQEYPGSTFTLCTKPYGNSPDPVFFRFFVCFNALKQGWLKGCRKLLCVDACFLKTFLGGQLISAIGRDANDQMYPLAWAVVEGENNESYKWFFQQLKIALGAEDGEGWTFVSDEHQSILTMVGEEFSKAEHRRCARHIFANWHKSYKGDDMKMMYWNCAHSYNQADFNDAITAMKEEDPRAAEAFLKCNPNLFCRAFINTRTANNVIVSNMAETFNAYIVNARSKHIIYMLEDIRTMLMQRLVIKKKAMEELDGTICPKIQDKLEKEKRKAAYCTPLPSSPTVFQVKDGIDEVSVNLVEKTCTCRKWDVTGIPCSHAIAAIFHLRLAPEDYVHECYRKDTNIKAYALSIGPCPGERHWPKVDAPLIPPPIKVGPGRPRKKRRRGPHEDPKRSGKLTKHGVEMTCSLCKSKEHNKRKCPMKGALVVEEGPKRGRGRPKRTSDNNVNESLNEVIAHPSRLGRSGRVIKRRGGRSGTRGRGGRNGTRGGGNSGALQIVTSQATSQPTTQVSSNINEE